MRESYYRHFLQVSFRYLVCIKSYEFELYIYVIFELCSRSVNSLDDTGLHLAYFRVLCTLYAVRCFVRNHIVFIFQLNYIFLTTHRVC